MNNTPKHIRDYWDRNPVYKCERDDEGDCSGRLTKEHSLIYAGRQIQELWAILDICEYHHSIGKYHGVGNLDKKKHEWLAISKMTPEDMAKYPKRNWKRELELLNKIYGK